MFDFSIMVKAIVTTGSKSANQGPGGISSLNLGFGKRGGMRDL
jgi:hypothetical protein